MSHLQATASASDTVAKALLPPPGGCPPKEAASGCEFLYASSYATGLRSAALASAIPDEKLGGGGQGSLGKSDLCY